MLILSQNGKRLIDTEQGWDIEATFGFGSYGIGLYYSDSRIIKVNIGNFDDFDSAVVALFRVYDELATSSATEVPKRGEEIYD